MFNFQKNQSGISAIIVVIIIGAACLLMAKGAAFLSLGELDMGRVSAKGHETDYLAEACLEEALLRLKIDNDYAVADYELPIGDSSCLLAVTDSIVGKTITAIGVNDEYQKELRAEAVIVDGVVDLSSLETVDY